MTDRLLLVLALVSGVTLLGVQVWSKPRPDAEEVRAHARMFVQPAQWTDRLAPEFEVTLLDGSTFRLSEHVGRSVIVLNFFATWCAPCRAEMPELQRYQAAKASEGLLLVGIDAEEKHSVVQKFVDALHLTFPIGIDESGDLLKTYDVYSFPTTIVIGADGRVKLYEIGAIMNADIALDKIVAPEFGVLKAGKGITVDAYRAALAAEPKPAATPTAASDRPLEGRGRKIAEAMPCPCGCEDKVIACSCQTAKKIKTKLREGGLDGRTDEEVMQALNKEFCMKGM